MIHRVAQSWTWLKWLNTAQSRGRPATTQGGKTDGNEEQMKTTSHIAHSRRKHHPAPQHTYTLQLEMKVKSVHSAWASSPYCIAADTEVFRIL